MDDWTQSLFSGHGATGQRVYDGAGDSSSIK